MSLYKYFKRKDLPTPEETGVGERATKVANASVAEVVVEVGAKKRKRYTSFTITTAIDHYYCQDYCSYHYYHFLAKTHKLRVETPPTQKKEVVC